MTLLTNIMNHILDLFAVCNRDKIPPIHAQYMFDKFTTSRKEDNGFKMSWHLVLFPNLYYILTI